jgi:HD-GYP domain-containing protein (c-di-GMP phosphodiesterase class II)
MNRYTASRQAATRRSRSAGSAEPESITPAELELERAQLRSYAKDVRESYAREVRRTEELRDSYFATVKALAAAVEAKDDYTGGHLQRVHQLGLLLAEAVAPEDAADPQLAYGFLLHDVGKLSIPDVVLTKPGKLNEAEWELMRGHPEAGVRILENVPYLTRALDVVRHHHERWDGGGYPSALLGEQIPLWARIFAVVDTVDAITSDRPYRDGRSLSVALAALREAAGTQFDPACVEAFCGLDLAAAQRLIQERPPALSRLRA